MNQIQAIRAHDRDVLLMRPTTSPLHTSRPISAIRITYNDNQPVPQPLFEYNYAADQYLQVPVAGTPTVDIHIVIAANNLMKLKNHPSFAIPAPELNLGSFVQAQRQMSKRAIKGGKSKSHTKSKSKSKKNGKTSQHRSEAQVNSQSDTDSSASGAESAQPKPVPFQKKAKRVQAALATAHRSRVTSPENLVHGPSKLRLSSTPEQMVEDMEMEQLEIDGVDFLTSLLMQNNVSKESGATSYALRTPSPPPPRPARVQQTKSKKVPIDSNDENKSPMVGTADTSGPVTPPTPRRSKRKAEAVDVEADMARSTSPCKKVKIRLTVNRSP